MPRPTRPWHPNQFGAKDQGLPLAGGGGTRPAPLQHCCPAQPGGDETAAGYIQHCQAKVSLSIFKCGSSFTGRTEWIKYCVCIGHHILWVMLRYYSGRMTFHVVVHTGSMLNLYGVECAIAAIIYLLLSSYWLQIWSSILIYYHTCIIISMFNNVTDMISDISEPFNGTEKPVFTIFTIFWFHSVVLETTVSRLDCLAYVPKN